MRARPWPCSSCSATKTGCCCCARLAQQERTVSELEQLTGVSQPTLSQQLGILRREGLVSTRREGKFIWYQLTDARALQLMQALYQLFCQPGETT